MNYIVMDLEWNQSNTGHEEQVKTMPFEIIEIGAILLDEEFCMVSEFSELIKPKVYKQMHQITSKLVNMQMEELQMGKDFSDVVTRFLEWCGDEGMFCTWGCLDLTELQRNLKYYDMTSLSEGPIPFLDVQKLFSLVFEDGKSRRSLEYAVDFLKVEKDIPFHRAFSDAYYTAKVFQEIIKVNNAVLRNISFDIYNPPKSRAEEIKIQFETYNKYISRAFEDKVRAFNDKEVSSSKCYYCHRNLRKKIRWFTPNGKHYYCIAYCEKHGFLKCKLRFHKTFDDKVFVVKTTKFVDEAVVDNIIEKKEHAKELKKRNKANKKE